MVEGDQCGRHAFHPRIVRCKGDSDLGSSLLILRGLILVGLMLGIGSDGLRYVCECCWVGRVTEVGGQIRIREKIEFAKSNSSDFAHLLLPKGRDFVKLRFFFFFPLPADLKTSASR